jgi:hypothetical protein
MSACESIETPNTRKTGLYPVCYLEQYKQIHRSRPLGQFSLDEVERIAYVLFAAESDQFAARLQGGNFNTGRGFLAYSPDAHRIDSYIAYEGSYTDGPFQSPGRYRRDNVNANYTKALDETQKVGFQVIFGRNNFYSSGQIPLDLVSAGLLDRFGYVDPTDGGRVKLGTFSSYYSKNLPLGICDAARKYGLSPGSSQESYRK